MVDGKWAKEERNGDMPFNRGTNFTLKIEAAELKYQVYVNGLYFCDYRYAVAIQQLGFIKVFGDVHINRTSVSIHHQTIELRRNIEIGDWIRYEMTRSSDLERFIHIGNETKTVFVLNGKKGKHFTASCNSCPETPIDVVFGDQEKIIMAIEILSGGLVKILQVVVYDIIFH
ncbi:uncharacterized protein LOC131940170 [Physella acuta]|uniref:uncharacterized protein LOC131940170 n=1 Tax=Physella acuta TaxID=109671 RepID=UPI0027DD623D|nr:uncharacterized protein LOC131940170 [Physella acuta]